MRALVSARNAVSNCLLPFSAIAVLSCGWVTRDAWYPEVRERISRVVGSFRESSDQSRDPHSGHIAGSETGAHHSNNHDHAGHDHSQSLHLTAQARRNLGLTADRVAPITLQAFDKSITVPAVVTERPGRTRLQVATPMTGVVTHVHALQGQAVEPGTLLIQIRLTHEDLVQAQTDFLRTLGELDVERREIARLENVTKSGAVAGRVLLEREYERDKLEALLSAQREALRLHGLSIKQIDSIVEQRELLRELQVFAPHPDDHSDEELRFTHTHSHTVKLTNAEHPTSESTGGPPLVLQELHVHKGHSVNAGETLCTLADYQTLYLEGIAFEQDIPALQQASAENGKVTAVFPQPRDTIREIPNLEIAYIANQVDPESRTLSFFVELENSLAKDHVTPEARYIQWNYLPGQRLHLRIPVETWEQQIVLPIEAVAREGADYYVFQQNGDHFDRIPVHIKYRDQFSVVIANDGSVYPGDVIARAGAHQMQMVLKNQSGGAVDPHAGHSH